MSNLWNDTRYALRTFGKAPLFTVVAIVSLALGIGANTAIFTLLDQLLLRLLPVKDPAQLVALKMEGSHYGSNWGLNAISYPMYKDFRDQNQVFSGMFCRFATATSLGYGNRTERVNAELVSGTYFPVLGVTAAVGRVIGPDDDRLPGGHPLVVLSHAFWETRFSSDPNIIGKQLVVNGRNMTVIGVAQRGFDGIQLEYQAKVFIPVMMKAQITPNWDGLKDRRQRWVNAFGRLKPGISLTQAQASLQPMMHGMLEMEVREPDFRNASSYTRQQFLRSWIHLLPGGKGHSYVRDALTTPLWVLLAITGAVLLMACTNLANLLLARATSRQKEMAIRLAIGANRGQIVRQLLIESFVLSFCGALVGLCLSFAADRLLLWSFLPADTGEFGFKISTAPDVRILAFTVCITLVTTVLFGLAPALRASRPDVAPTLKDEAGSVVGGTHVGVRKTLVAGQVALSLLLLIAAGLFIKTLVNLRGLGPGFPIERLIGFNLDPSLNGYSNERVKIFYKQLTEDLESIPGVHSVGLAAMRILEESEWDSSMTVEGYTAKPGQSPEPFMNAIGPNYFKTLGVPVIQGRDFTYADVDRVKHWPDKEGSPVEDTFAPSRVIINQTFAKKYFAGRNPIGLHVGFGADPGTKTDMEVIGLVKDIKYTNLRDEIPPQAFVPYLADRHPRGMTVYVRTSLEPKEIMSLIQAKVHALDSNVPIYSMRTTEEQIDMSLRIERFVASLSSVFGFLATTLAVVGLYGVMAFTVARRTREIGIRMALGALRGNVIWMVMREVLMLIAGGIFVGIPAAIGLTTLIRKLLFGLAPGDPSTIVLATLTAILVASLAGFIPALRASQVDPTQALRYE